ncbi:MAG TPA: secretin N-terminal domain-containing protein, partial [Hyphomicrobiales bacterium]|nr:secretin N-terminal domain-containing protein [Hyphomicrobiales bacterium]
MATNSFQPAPRAALALLLSLCLGACSTLQQTPSAPPAPVITQPLPAAATATAPEVQAESTEDAAADINRDGRVIQLGRFSETPPPGTPPTNDVVELNYEQEDLRVVFEQLGDALGINLVIDPTIDFKVSLRTSADNPLRYADIWPLMRMLARSAGVTIEQAGNLYQIQRNASQVPTELVLPEFLGQATASEVLQITPLRYISVEAAETVLNPMLQPQGSVIRLGPANLLGISGTPQELARVNALLRVIDDDPFQNQGIRLYDLQNSRAADVATELANVLQLIEGEQSSYQVLGLERVNAVLVVAPAARGFTEVDRWVRLLDAASQEQSEQLFVYRVKNLDAVDLAQTLNNAFGQQRTDNQQTRRATPPTPRPFASPLVPDQAQQPPPLGIQPAQPLNDTAQFAASDAAGAAGAAGAGGDNSVSANITVNVVADENTNALLVRASPREYRQLLSTIGSLDKVPAQVLIQAVIGQVTLTEGTRFGIDWVRVSGNLGSGPARLSANFLPGNIFDEVTGDPLPGSGLVLTRTFMDGSAQIDATLNAIAKDNEVKLLARPTILATNKQEGSIKVGQNVPVNNGTTIIGNGVSTQNIGYTDVGIELTITPQINSDGFISMQILQKLSSVEGVSVV